MKKKLVFILFVVCFLLARPSDSAAQHRIDTVYLSTLYTTHLIFSNDLLYADLSNPTYVAAKIIEQSSNMLAVKARSVFTEYTSISALESNGTMHTFIVKFREHPKDLVIDLRIEQVQMPEPPKYQSKTAEMIESAKASDDSRKEERKDRKKKDDTKGKAAFDPSNVSQWKTGSAPVLKDIVSRPQALYHVGTEEYDIVAMCEDICSYSDITYMTFSVRNRSGISYEIADATFVIESKRNGKKTVKYDKTVFPKSRYGSLCAGPGEYTRMSYSFDKMTLSKDQVLKVYLYEVNGQRNLVMTIDTDDINKAKSAL